MTNKKRIGSLLKQEIALTKLAKLNSIDDILRDIHFTDAGFTAEDESKIKRLDSSKKSFLIMLNMLHYKRMITLKDIVSTSAIIQDELIRKELSAVFESVFADAVYGEPIDYIQNKINELESKEALKSDTEKFNVKESLNVDNNVSHRNTKMRNKDFKKIMKIISTIAERKSIMFTLQEKNDILFILHDIIPPVDDPSRNEYITLIKYIESISNEETFNISKINNIADTLIKIKYPFMNTQDNNNKL